MAHAVTASGTPPARSNEPLNADSVRKARIDLAACLRWAARSGLEEGICNHFSAVLPERPDLFLVNPYGLAFAEVTASSLLLCDFHGNVVEGDGQPEATAFHIHAELHRLKPRARAAFHTHMPYATALAMLEGQPLAWAGQTALRFYGRIAVDEDYNGLALDSQEGQRIAASAGEADVVFLKNHGVMVLGETIAEAWDDLYYLERAAQAQVLALSTGRSLKTVPEAIVQRVAAQEAAGRAESARLHLESVKRVLARDEPAFLA
ncbi:MULTISPECIES: aldolase [unclassified Methylobacterium]|uniref:aldolase n=1 Tax=unclassified Methylobacterium TaxID=2615210 RepID=UPI002269A270|nr:MULTISPECIES: aldolase [unclassified Methylobacterium]